MKTINIEELGRAVESPIDYIQMMENVYDSYPLGLSHGLQKDAIQNGVDARKKTTKWKKWSFSISLVENKIGNFLILEDAGTVGLTGKLTAKDVKNIFPAKEERWARFESFAFAKKDKTDLGARGQGKLIMFRGSKLRTIVYDSLREDGTYRVGISVISNTGRKVLTFEGKKAERQLFQICNLAPISHAGTRVMVLDPEADIIQSIEDGSMLSSIEDTWWPVIAQGGKIMINARGVSSEAKIPLRIQQLQVNKKVDNPNFKISKITKHIFTVGRGQENEYTIKDFVLGYDADGIAKDEQGISIFRGGMKIENYRIRTGLIPEMDNVYGYVVCDNKLDEALRENELPSHYGFGSRKGVYAKLTQEIEGIVNDFARKELKVGIQNAVDINDSEPASFKDAMRLFADVVKDLNLFGSGQGGTREATDPIPVDKKPVSLTIEDLKFPDPTLARVNYGDTLENFVVSINNRFVPALKYELIGYVKQGNTELFALETYKGISLPGTKEQIPLESQKAYSIPINKEIFTAPGFYKLEFQLLDGASNTKERQAITSRMFYVEQNPPLPRGPFKVERAGFSRTFPEFTMKQSFLHRAGEDTILYVNITHSAYTSNGHIEIILTRYLTMLYTEAAIQISVEGVVSGEVDPDKIQVPFDLRILGGKDPVAVLKEHHKAMGFFANKIYTSRTW